jgi:hypothetical protein
MNANGYKTLLAILASAFFMACSNPVKQQKAELAKVRPDTLISTLRDTAAAVKDDCVGAVPDFSIIDSTKCANRKFHCADRTGYDDFVTANGDSISLVHTICYYDIMKFVIQTNRFHADTSDITYWARATADILADVDSLLLSSNINMDSSGAYLKQYYSKKNKDAKISDPISFGGPDEFATVATLNNIENKGRYTQLTIILRKDM